jgi:hypothetical protein
MIGNTKYTINEKYFTEINSEDKAYILGLFYTDGNVSSKSNRICLGMNDLDVIEFVKSKLEATNPIHIIKDKRTIKLHYRLDIFNKQLRESLINLGCVPVKSKIIVFPDDKIVSDEFLKYFILGCFDGDGSVFSSDNKNFTWNFVGTKSMCDGISSYIKNNLDIVLNVKLVPHFQFLYQIRCSKRDDIFKLLEYLYYDVSFKMKRKYVEFIKIKNLIDFRPTNQYWKDRKRNDIGEFIYG